MMIRNAASLLALAILATASGVWAQPTGPDVNYDESRVGDLPLPDPLVAGGRDVEDAATWTERRRPEILELFRTQVYGRAPGAPPEHALRGRHAGDRCSTAGPCAGRSGSTSRGSGAGR